jgi:hypothetical protein
MKLKVIVLVSALAFQLTALAAQTDAAARPSVAAQLDALRQCCGVCRGFRFRFRAGRRSIGARFPGDA